MKKIINKITLMSFTLCLVVLSSCNDATDIIQVGELNEEVAFQTLADIRSGLNGAYANYGPDFGGNDSGVDAIYFNAIFTDNTKAGIDNNGQGNLTYSFNLQPGSDTPNTIWGNRYATINAVNRVLRAIDQIEFEDNELTEVNHIKAQLLTLRALSHLDLFQYYTEDYQNDSELSVIIMNFVPNIEDAFERNTVAETVAFIKSDLDAADAMFDASLSQSNGVFYLNSDASKAIRTRLALCVGDYGTANTLSSQLVASYPLADQASYFGMFADTVVGESIFTLSRLAGDADVAGLWYFNAVAADGGAYIEMSNDLYNQFNSSDIRFSVNVSSASVFNGPNDPNNLLLINKYPGSGDGALVNDIKLFRSSEMLLIRAETEARNNQLMDAAISIQQLRTARYGASVPPMPTFGTTNEALAAILQERRLELCYEGHRYLDLKRLGGELNVGVVREDADCESFSATQCNLPANDYRFTLPIPTAEIEGNTAISQNPNY
ncbi:MAG: RagB/SusD family nutrient uptake outer membrane protein [Aquaticitalea sp.]